MLGERSKRGAAVAAVAALNRMRDAKGPSLSDEYEKTLHKIRAERIKRAASKGSLPGQQTGRKRNRQQHDSILDAHALGDAFCFICGIPLPSNADEINAHIDSCLEKGGSFMNGTRDEGQTALLATSSSAQQWDEYSWAGQTRVRATALLEGGFEGSGFQVHKLADQDTDEDIDIDIDDDGTVEYGLPQFGEDDLQDFIDIDDSGPPFVLPVGTPEQPAQPQEPVHAPHLISKAPLNVTADVQLVIDSLKSRIRELEAALPSSSQKCLICMEAYKDPLASTICWHVHCQECWLRTLGAKRLCPQCQKITAPNDLRRIYL
eukprot:jgi/Hompol1/714/HPOL_002414-RA